MVRFTSPQTHPSTNTAGSQTCTCLSQVRRPSHYISKPPTARSLEEIILPRLLSSQSSRTSLTVITNTDVFVLQSWFYNEMSFQHLSVTFHSSTSTPLSPFSDVSSRQRHYIYLGQTGNPYAKCCYNGKPQVMSHVYRQMSLSDSVNNSWSWI